jgi:polyphenol oxidase
MPDDVLRPDWPASLGAAGLMSTRLGGVSAAPFDSLNLRLPAPGDDRRDELAAVQENRRRYAQACGATPVYLHQVHGCAVARLSADSTQRVHEADASLTTEPGIACTVLVADCLPVLFAAPGGRGVAAAHAGWRGLAGGVLDATVAALTEASGCAAGELHAWLGACIGPRQFEVGPDVLAAFGASADQPGRLFTLRVKQNRQDGSPRWLADLPALARERLAAVGVHQVSGGTVCTVEDRSRLFSFRRDRLTGRMAASVWITR